MDDLSAPLYRSVESDNCEELRRLVSIGADVDQVYEDLARISTKSILHVACEKGRFECVRILLENGAKVNSRDPWGMTPLRYCLSSDYDEIAHILLQSDPEIADTQDKYGKSALHVAAEYGSEKFVRMLLNSGADVNITTEFGVTPLMSLMASKETPNYFEIMKILVDAGADVNCYDLKDKRTALHLATITKKVDAVELLLSHKVDPNVVDKGLRTPMTSLICYHIPVTRKCTEVADDVMTIAILLTQAGTDLNAKTTEFSNPLVMAAYGRCTPLVRYFLDNGADVNITFDYTRITPLLVAVKQNDIETARALLNWNCKVDIKGRCRIRRDDHDYDPFELAVDQGYWDIVELLVFFGYNTSKHSYLRDCCDDSELPSSLKNNKDMLELLRMTAMAPNTMVKCCTLAIYESISSNISEKVDSLPLPTSIRNYLKISFL